MIFTSFRNQQLYVLAAQHHLLTIKGKNMGGEKRQEKTGPQKGGEKEKKAREEEKKRRNGWRRKGRGEKGS